MYGKKADIIFHAAGDAGNGLFQTAKFINQARPAKDRVWVIGVDTDQSNLGKYYAKGGQEANFVLTSVVTGVNRATKNIASRSYQGKFPGGKTIVYGLKTMLYLSRQVKLVLTRGRIYKLPAIKFYLKKLSSKKNALNHQRAFLCSYISFISKYMFFLTFAF